LVHVEHGDANTVAARHSLFRHLWISEEGEAHRRGLRTAAGLRLRQFDPVLWEYATFIYALPTSYVLLLLLLGLAAVCGGKVRSKAESFSVCDSAPLFIDQIRGATPQPTNYSSTTME
jgi:hypothetical protein